jgi:serine protease
LLGFVDFAEKVPLIRTVGTATLPNDLQLSQWGLTKIQAEMAWTISQGSSTVKVAIVDNAERITHEDLGSVIWTNPNEVPNNFFDDDLNGYPDDAHGFDVADFDANVNPPTGITGWNHGTHCAGIAGAATNNGIGIASIGYGISIIPVKAANNAAGGNTLAKAFEGVDYARAAGADVISMSWGSKGTSAIGDLILSLASNQGIVLVAAAGNNGDSILFYPAANPLCIAVGSTDINDLRSPFSNFGSYVDVMAPGSDIYSCLAGSENDYGNQSGTSMACPLTAGLAGLILSMAPNLTAQQVRTLIVNGCEDIDALNPGFEGKLGAGRINAFQSMVTTAIASPGGMESGISVYPHPATGQFWLRLPDSWSYGSIRVEVTDLSGAVKARFQLASPAEAIDCSGLPAGLYLLRLQQGHRSHAQLLQLRG